MTKEQKRLYDIEYRKKNSNKIKEKRKQYREENRERLVKQSSEYYYKNREKLLSKNRKLQIKQICVFCKKKFYNKQISKYCSKNCCTKQWFINNKDYDKEWKKNFRKKNPDKVRKRENLYREKNKEKVKEWGKKYRNEHKEEIAKKRKEWLKQPKNKLNNRIRASMCASIKNKNKRKWESLVGYSLNDLIIFFREKYNFDIDKDLNENYHIDHIIPISYYNFSSYNDEDFKKCWNLRNLRPISKKENLKKHNKVDMKLIKEHKIEDLLPEVF